MRRFVMDAKVLETDECSSWMWKHLQLISVKVVPRQLPEGVFELKAMYLLVAVVKSLRWTVASLAVVLTRMELVEPKVLAVGSDFSLGAKMLWVADHVLKDVVPMMVVTEFGQVLVPMDLNWHQTGPEVAFGLIASKVVEFGLVLEMVAMY